MAECCQWRKCTPYMGALAAAVGCAWRDTLRWEVGVAGSARQAAGCNGQCASTAGFLVIVKFITWIKYRCIKTSKCNGIIKCSIYIKANKITGMRQSNRNTMSKTPIFIFRITQTNDHQPATSSVRSLSFRIGALVSEVKKKRFAM